MITFINTILCKVFFTEIGRRLYQKIKVSVLILQTKSRSFPIVFIGRTSAQLPTEGETKNIAPIFLKFKKNLGLVIERVPRKLQSSQLKNEDAAFKTLSPPPLAHVVIHLNPHQESTLHFQSFFLDAVLSFFKLLS